MLVAVTRLRIRALRYLPAFALQTLRSALQAKAAPGNVAVLVLGEAHRVFWTQTVWTDEAAMRAFMQAQPHRAVMAKLATWCDEAAVVHWTQDTSEIASWDDARQRMQRDGRPSKLRHPSPAHDQFQIAAPRIRRFGELRFK